MIGIAYIDSSNMKTFSERLETFMNEHPEAKILYISRKGIEGGKGVFAILSYDKKEEPTPTPNDNLAKARAAKAKKEAEEKARKEAEEKAKKEAELAAKKAELEQQIAELGK